MFQLCLVALAQEYECLHLCVPRLVHISPKVSTSAFDESVNRALYRQTHQLCQPFAMHRYQNCYAVLQASNKN